MQLRICSCCQTVCSTLCGANLSQTIQFTCKLLRAQASNTVPSLTRLQLASMLEDRMRRAYSSLAEEQVLEAGTGLVKTHLLELNYPQGEAQSPAALLDDLWSSNLFSKDHKPRVEQSDDDLLYATVHTTNGEVHAYVDISDARFAVLHTVSPSTAVDWALNRLVTQSHWVDRVWMDSEFLLGLRELGAVRGLGLDYDRRSLYGDLGDEELSKLPVNYLKMQLWGNRAGEVLDLLRRSDIFPNSTSVSKLKIKHIIDTSESDVFAIEDIRFDGKFTSRGTSFDSHNNVVTHVVRHYRHAVESIERDHRIRYESAENLISVVGRPAIIQYNENLVDFDQLLIALSSGKPPYRLFGVPSQTGDRSFRIRALDLHIGHRLDLELTPGQIRVYLPGHSCGNTVLRLVTNMQRTLDSVATLSTLNT